MVSGRGITATIPAYRDFKSNLSRVECLPDDSESLVEIAAQRLSLSYWSHNAFGSGPRGGYNQISHNGRLDECWSPDRLAKKIRFHHQRLCRVKAEIGCEDFQALIEDTSSRSLLFCDPPYRGYLSYYGRKFSREDHQRLADLLGTTEHAWVLTYGDHPDIRRLYSGWAHVEEIGCRNLLITR